jgi:hypothetical protein
VRLNIAGQRYGRGEDNASAWPASPQTSFVSGAELLVAGGFSP